MRGVDLFLHDWFVLLRVRELDVVDSKNVEASLYSLISIELAWMREIRTANAEESIVFKVRIDLRSLLTLEVGIACLFERKVRR
jgi:hypothetical protein